MKNLEQIISQIDNHLKSNDLTNTPQFSKMAENYVNACNIFNEKAQECNKLIERNMVAEAMQLYSKIVPPLEIQADLLNFPNKDLFLQCFEIYDWQQAPALQTGVLDLLHVKSTTQKGLEQLLNAYRKIARSDDIVTKINLLRKISVIDKSNPEWRTSLASLENIRLQQLTEAAKNAILANDFPKLELLRSELLNSKWSVEPNKMVINKINQVLENHRLDEMKKVAAEYLNNINDAYSSFDYDSLEKWLNAYHALVSDEGYIPDENFAMQVKEAENYYLEQKKLRDEQTVFDSLVQKLRNGLANEAPITDLERIFNQAIMMEKPFPDMLKEHFYSYKDSVENCKRRKRLLMMSSAAVGIIVVAAIIISVVSSIIMKATENEWVKRIDTALENEPSAISLKLLKDLEQISPKIRKRSAILELEAKVNSKRDSEEKKRRDFQTLVAKIRNGLKDFEKNQNMLLEAKVQARMFIVDQTEENIYREIEREFQNAKDNTDVKYNREYQLLVSQIKDLRRDFFAAIEDDDFDKARYAVGKSLEFKTKAMQMGNVSVNVKIANARYLDEVEELERKLSAEISQRIKVDEQLSRLRTTTSLEDLYKAAENFVSIFPERKESKKIKILLQNLNLVSKVAPENPFETGDNKIYEDSIKKYYQFSDSCQHLHASLKNKLNAMAKSFNSNSVYSIILESKSGLREICFTSKNFAWQQNGNTCECFITALMYVTGETQTVKLSYLSHSPSVIDVSFRKVGERFKGRLIYPKSIKFKGDLAHLAPHITLINDLNAKLNKVSPRIIEETSFKMCNEILSNRLINPYFRVTMVHEIIKELRKYAPRNKSYKDMEDISVTLLDTLPTNFSYLRCYEDSLTCERILKSIKEMSEIKFRPSSFEQQVYDIMLSRKIIPAGYVTKREGTYELSALHSLSESGEVWAFSSKAPHWRIIGTFERNKLNISNSELKKLSEMQILYTPTDGRETKQLQKELLELAKENEIENIKWPSLWPVL